MARTADSFFLHVGIVEFLHFRADSFGIRSRREGSERKHKIGGIPGGILHRTMYGTQPRSERGTPCLLRRRTALRGPFWGSSRRDWGRGPIDGETRLELTKRLSLETIHRLLRWARTPCAHGYIDWDSRRAKRRCASSPAVASRESSGGAAALREMWAARDVAQPFEVSSRCAAARPLSSYLHQSFAGSEQLPRAEHHARTSMRVYPDRRTERRREGDGNGRVSSEEKGHAHPSDRPASHLDSSRGYS